MSRPYASESVFRAVADPTRRRLIELLQRSDQSAIELAQAVRVTLPTLSHHLGILRACGLIRQRRAGRQRLHRLNTDPLRVAAAWFRAWQG